MEVKCEKCGETNEEELDLHHIIPKCIGGTDRDGRIYLCEKHHNILHNFLLGVVWQNRKLNERDIHLRIKEFTKRWCNERGY